MTPPRVQGLGTKLRRHEGFFLSWRDDPALGDFIELLGEELDESGAHDEAEPLLERALSVYESAIRSSLERSSGSG